MSDFKEWLEKNKIETAEGYKGDIVKAEYLHVSALGEWAWGQYLVYFSHKSKGGRWRVKSKRRKEFYFEIASACLGEAEIEKRLKGEKQK